MTTAANIANHDRPCTQCEFKRYFGPTVTARVYLEGEVIPRVLQLKYEGWQKLEQHRISHHQTCWRITRNIPRLIREIGAEGTRGEFGHMQYAWCKADVASNDHDGADSWYAADAGHDQAYVDQWARLVAMVNVRWTEDVDGDMHAHIAAFTGKNPTDIEITFVTSAGMSRCLHSS